jgi:hypothetical protein
MRVTSRRRRPAGQTAPADVIATGDGIAGRLDLATGDGIEVVGDLGWPEAEWPDDTDLVGVDGQASPFVAVVPVRAWLFTALSALLAVGGRIPSFALDRAALIHFGQWGVLARQRSQVGRPGRLRSSLVFVSVFDGEVDQYIVTFASLLPLRFAQVFGFCVKFPGSAPSGPLLAYIDRHTHRTPFFTTAYGRRTVSDVRAALWTSARLRELAAAAPALPAAELRTRLRDLAGHRDRDARIVYRTPRWQLTRSALVGRFDSMSFTTLAPVTRGRERELADRLAALQADPRAHAAFRAIPSTHYARLAVVDPLYDLDDEPMHYAPALLLLSVQFDRTEPRRDRNADVRAYLDQLFDQVKQLPIDPWEHCDGYPPRPDRRLFVDFLRVGAVPTGLFLPGVAATAPAIRAAVLDEARFVRLRADHLDRPSGDEALAGAFAAAFGDGRR